MSESLQIASKNLLLREALAIVLEADTEFTEVRHSGNYALSLRWLREQPPDLLMVDLQQAEEAAQRLVTKAVEAHKDLCILLLGNGESHREGVRCLAAGARGYFSLNDPLERLPAALERLRAGERICTPEMMAAVMQHLNRLSGEKQHRRKISQLRTQKVTELDLKILEHAAAGLTNKEIGEALSISFHAVKNRLSKVAKVLRVTGRSKIVTAALERGWINVPPPGPSPT